MAQQYIATKFATRSETCTLDSTKPPHSLLSEPNSTDNSSTPAPVPCHPHLDSTASNRILEQHEQEHNANLISCGAA
eukprot:1160305-Pelagomonas_calceolata.AAC.1